MSQASNMGASAVSRSARIDQSFNASASMRRTGVSGRSKASRAAREKAAAVAGDGPRKLVADPAHPNLTVWENGKDVTPLSLIKLAGAGGATSDHASAAGSLDQPSLITAAKESMGMGMSSSMYESASNLADGSFADAGGGPAAQQNAGAAGGDQVVAWSANARSKAADDSAADALAAPLTVAELAASITLLLRETETFFWLDVEGDVVGKEIPAEHAAVVANNERVARLAAARPNTLDKYSQRAAQTFAFELKVKEVMTTATSVSSMGCQAHLYEIEDAMAGAGASGGSGSGAREDVVAVVTGVAAPLAEPSRESGRGSTSQSLASFGPSATVGASTLGGGHDASSSSSQLSSSAISMRGGDAGASASQPGYYAGGGDAEAVARARATAKLALVLNSEQFAAAAHALERMVTQNELQTQHRIYRDVQLGPGGAPVPSGAEALMAAALGGSASADGGRRTGRVSSKGGGRDAAALALAANGAAALHPLWTFGCAETSGHNVSSLAWNPVATDVLAASYGQFDFAEQRAGLVALWALQTPHHPLRLWHFPSGATALAFSRLQPHLLAVGLYSGMVGVYDVRSAEPKAVCESHPITGKHNEPVWQLRWVERLGRAGGDENLVSVSTDGRVTQWALKKGLERTDLMRLKRLPGLAGSMLGRSFVAKLDKEKAEEEAKRNAKDGVKPKPAAAPQSAAVDVGSEGGIISRRAAGLSIAFSQSDPSLYICGTEDGFILKCSTSYSEQHLETYTGHRGPVYRLAYSPFAPSVFLSCSADWTVRVWNTDGDVREPILTLQSSMHAVNDAAWSPISSTAFAAVTADGRLDLWDLETSTLDPVAHIEVDSPLSAVAFAPVDPVVVAGSRDGQIHVFRVYGPAASSMTRTLSAEAQLERLVATIAPSPLAEIS